MPQMAPMLWLILFIYFIILFILFISNFYFTYTPKSLSAEATLGSSMKSFNWSW